MPGGAVFACKYNCGALLLGYVDRQFTKLVGLPHGTRVRGTPLQAVIAHLIDPDSFGTLLAGVAAGHQIIIILAARQGSKSATRLMLKPGTTAGSWVGTLSPIGPHDAGEVAVETAVLRRIDAPAPIDASDPPRYERSPGAQREAQRASILRSAATDAGIGLLEWDIVSGDVRADANVHELFGLSIEEPILHIDQLHSREHAADRLRTKAAFKALIRGPANELYCAYRIKAEPNTWHWLLAMGRMTERGPDGRAKSYVGTLRAIAPKEHPVSQGDESALTAHAEVREYIVQIEELENQIRTITSREQQRIGHDLHDNLGQELFAISLLLKSLCKEITLVAPFLETRVQSLQDMFAQCIAGTKAFARGLSPIHLDGGTFAAALSRLAQNIENIYGIPIGYSGPADLDIDNLEAADNLYRIIQEALSNASKHAAAGRIELRVKLEDDHLIIDVEDDGLGLHNAARETSGMGMKIMRYRANIVPASLEFLQGAAGGTLVRCTLKKDRSPEGVDS